MKQVGIYIIIAFIFYLIGQVIWFLIIIEKPIFDNEYLDNLIIHQVFTFFGIFGLISGITLYKLKK